MSGFDSLYFDFINEASIRSARILLPELLRFIRPKSVVDIGCGEGAWLKVWKQLGVSEVLGVDGDYVDRDSLLIDQSEFVSADLTEPLDLGRTFELVQCLEVAEHLPEAAADVLVKTLTRHGQFVVFSAAVPGQGGFRHINERSYEYWRNQFGQLGYIMFDPVRSKIHKNSNIEPWYAFNTFLYVSESVARIVPEGLQRTRLSESKPIRDYSPPVFRTRKAVLRNFPMSVVSALHLVKKNIFLFMLKFRTSASRVLGDNRSSKED